MARPRCWFRARRPVLADGRDAGAVRSGPLGAALGRVRAARCCSAARHCRRGGRSGWLEAARRTRAAGAAGARPARRRCRPQRTSRRPTPSVVANPSPAGAATSDMRAEWQPVMTLGVPGADGGIGRIPAFQPCRRPRNWCATARPDELLAALRAACVASQLDAGLVLPALTPASAVSVWRRACAGLLSDPTLQEAARTGSRLASPELVASAPAAWWQIRYHPADAAAVAGQPLRLAADLRAGFCNGAQTPARPAAICSLMPIRNASRARLSRTRAGPRGRPTGSTRGAAPGAGSSGRAAHP